MQGNEKKESFLIFWANFLSEVNGKINHVN